MNKKRGFILVFSMLVLVFLFIFAIAFFTKSINENNFTKRYVNSLRAFWLAEAGIAKAITNLPSLSTSGALGGDGYVYSATVTDLNDSYYQISSWGFAFMRGVGTISRRLIAIVEAGDIDSDKFKYAIETTTDLVIKGSVEIDPEESKKEFSTLDFSDIFNFSKADIKSYATHLYTQANFAAPVDGITWVDVPSGSTLTIAGNLEGSGILVISGDAHLAGTVNFNGIIYVIGELTITGTVECSGAVLAESSTTVDTEIKGNVTLHYDKEEIENALEILKFLNVNIVSWKEL